MIHTALSRKISGALSRRTFLGCACIAGLTYGLLMVMAKQLTGLASTRAAGRIPIPDLSRQLTGDGLADILDSYGPAGRWHYGVMEVLDFAYMFGWASVAAFAVTAGLAAVKAPKILRSLNLLPVAMLAVDVVENVGILAMLATYPKHVQSLAPAVAAAVRIKWQMAVVLLGLLAVIGIWWAVRSTQRAISTPSRSKGSSGEDSSSKGVSAGHARRRAAAADEKVA